MNRWLVRASTTLALVALISGTAGAGQGKKPGKTAAKAMTCSVCHMPLSAKKTKENPVAVKINGKTYYCCNKCDMHMKKGGVKKTGAAKNHSGAKTGAETGK